MPYDRYYMTKLDVVDHNSDLIAAAAKILKGLPKQSIGLTAVPAARQQFTVNFSNVDRVDIALNDRPVLSLDVKSGSVSVTLPEEAAIGSILTANGYRDGRLVVNLVSAFHRTNSTSGT